MTEGYRKVEFNFSDNTYESLYAKLTEAAPGAGWETEVSFGKFVRLDLVSSTNCIFLYKASSPEFGSPEAVRVDASRGEIGFIIYGGVSEWTTRSSAQSENRISNISFFSDACSYLGM